MRQAASSNQHSPRAQPGAFHAWLALAAGLAWLERARGARRVRLQHHAHLRRSAEDVPQPILLLSTKIDSTSRCALYEGEARAEGFDDCAQVFSQLALKDREEIDALLECLREHLEPAHAG
jgi:hypothetical protein